MTTCPLWLSYLYGVGKRYRYKYIDAYKLLMLDLVGLVGLVSNRLARLSVWLLRWSRWGGVSAPPNRLPPKVFSVFLVLFGFFAALLVVSVRPWLSGAFFWPIMIMW